jgi:uroporphyrin-3 C-methyltransferase
MDTENNSADNNTADPRPVVEPTPKARTNWRGYGISFTLLGFVILFGAYYYGMCRLIHLNKTLAATVAAVNTTVNDQQATITALQTSAGTAQKDLSEWHDELTKQQDLIGDLKKSYQAKNDTWSVAEAGYLVKLANANLQLGDNIPLIINLLQTASQELQGLTDPAIVTIRKALAADILSMQAVPAVDITGIYLQISALNGEVNKLPFIIQRPGTAPVTEVSTDQKWWQRGWQQTLTALKKIVVVRYNQSDVAPFILPNQQEFLLQNIHAMFEQAMSALVHRQPEIYRNSLITANEWIKKYFLPDSSVTQATLAALDKLQGVNIDPALPTLSATLQAFHDYSAQQKEPVNNATNAAA